MPFFLSLELVNFGNNYQERAIVELQPVPQLDILLHPSTPCIQQNHRQLQGASSEHVLLDQPFPLLPDFLGDFGESISWQIDKTESVVNLVEIN